VAQRPSDYSYGGLTTEDALNDPRGAGLSGGAEMGEFDENALPEDDFVDDNEFSDGFASQSAGAFNPLANRQKEDKESSGQVKQQKTRTSEGGSQEETEESEEDEEDEVVQTPDNEDEQNGQSNQNPQQKKDKKQKENNNDEKKWKKITSDWSVANLSSMCIHIKNSKNPVLVAMKKHPHFRTALEINDKFKNATNWLPAGGVDWALRTFCKDALDQAQNTLIILEKFEK
jgi:hypothetical protein